jgi:hypothetical protein
MSAQVSVVKSVPASSMWHCKGCLYEDDVMGCLNSESKHGSDCSDRGIQTIFVERLVDACTFCGSTAWAAKNPLYCTCCEDKFAEQFVKEV